MLVNQDAFDLILGEVETVYEPPPAFDFGSFPFAIGVPRGDGQVGATVLLSFSENADVADAELVDRALSTQDQGQSYTDLPDLPLQNAALLSDDRILSVGFVPTWDSGASQASFHLWESFDRGTTWSTREATFDAGEVIHGLRLHRGMVEVPTGPHAGTLLVPAYGLMGGSTTRSIELLASADGGDTWGRWGVIAPANDPTLTYDETTVEYTNDGGLVAVTRAYENGTLGPLLVSRSHDDGQTFSAVEPLELAFVGEDAMPRVGVDPGLARMPNGAMLLVGGRLDNWIALSPDNAESWQQAQLTYVNYPSGVRTRGSSGYQAVVPVSSHRAFLVGDNCANSWGCPASEDGWTVDGEHRIWRRLVDVAPQDPGRIDLATSLARAEISINSTLVADDAALAEASLIDGLLGTGSTLRGGGQIDIDLGQPQLITRLALASTPGAPPAHVLLFDGQTWIDPTITTGTDGDRSMRAFVPPQPRPVERIRIDVPEGGSVSELELYSVVNGFENEALGLAPRGALRADSVTTVQRPEEPSSQMLRLTDDSSEAIAAVSFPLDPGATTTSLRLRGLALPGSVLLGLADENGPLLHLAVGSEGALRRYDSNARAWETISPAGTVDPTQWFDVELGVDGSVRLDDAVFATRDLPAVPDRLYVTSTGTAPVGVDVLIDDVRLGYASSTK